MLIENTPESFIIVSAPLKMPQDYWYYFIIIYLLYTFNRFVQTQRPVPAATGSVSERRSGVQSDCRGVSVPGC